MRRIIGSAFLSLDGVMQAPGGTEEDEGGHFALGGWTWPHSDAVTREATGRLLSASYDLLLGRKTYDIFARFWPEYDPAGPAAEVARRFNAAAKYVVTGSDAPLAWRNSHAIGGDIAARVAEIKAGDGPDLFIQGSSTLYPQLFAAGLIDRVTLLTFPVVLGGGKRLFGDGTPPFALRLVDHVVSTTGVVIATYEPAGPVPTAGPPGR
ncbi:dihydrofolate reductase family protein [Sphingomonas sp.]|uniref:dihydrofolate reductase family protein n=1 Tax=Sphingomonas sp. TaxID=28214 RepID=UPI002CF4531D|nr:dihydrofolate reductase family protein [Sphingomonas sp.]HWK34964.1 dihydrofolate reductase family protein [Sphingomonas sp.]